MKYSFKKPECKMEFVGQLQPHPRNNEFFDDIKDSAWEEFKEDIAERGILNPIIIDPNGIIISGTQRWRAACELGFDQVPVWTRFYQDEDEMLLELIYSNIHQRFSSNDTMKIAKCADEIKRIRGVHNGRPPIEVKDAGSILESENNGSVDSVDTYDEEKGVQCTAFFEPPSPVAKGKVTMNELAQEFGVSVEKLRDILRLLDLIPELQDAVQDGQISSTTASRIIARLPEEAQRELFEQLGPMALGGMSGAELKKIVPQVERYLAQNRELSERIEELETALDEQPGAVFTENELMEAQAKIEKLELEKRKWYEKLQNADKNHAAQIRQLNTQYEQERLQYEQEKRKTVAHSDYIARAGRIREELVKLSRADDDVLRELEADIRELDQISHDLVSRIK